MNKNSGNVLLYILIPLGIIFLLGLSSYAVYYASKNFKNFPKPSSLPTLVSDIPQSPSLPAVIVTPSATVTVKTQPKAVQLTSTITPKPTYVLTATPTPRKCDFNYDSIFGDRKCFSMVDYGNLRSLEIEYEGTKNLLEGAKGTKDMTCDGSDFFKSSCEEAKKEIRNYEKELESIESEAKKIISRGWNN